MARENLRNLVGPDENILWEGKPDKKCTVLESIFNPLLLFVGVSIFIEFMMAKGLSEESEDGFIPLIFTGLFFLIPAVIYLIGILFSLRRVKNTSYMVTDKAIYISGGLITYNYQMKTYADISMINIHKGLVDLMCGLGDVIFVPTVYANVANTNNYSSFGSSFNFAIQNIADYERVFQLIRTQQLEYLKSIKK